MRGDISIKIISGIFIILSLQSSSHLTMNDENLRWQWKQNKRIEISNQIKSNGKEQENSNIIT